jgi:hypothetical protein
MDKAPNSLAVSLSGSRSNRPGRNMSMMALPRISRYLQSTRRLPFNEEGIFRHYPELDAASPRKGVRKGRAKQSA